MILKDTLRLIKQTYKRFLTIVAIVFIGVSFMMGLTSSSTIMRESVDKYNKELNFQDFQIYSNYGFCNEDVLELSKLDYIKDVYPSKQVDAYCRLQDGTQVVSRVREIDSDVNKFILKEGRLPQSIEEVVIIMPKNNKIKLNEIISVYLDDDSITDSLKYTTFKVVGFAESSEYMSKFISSSNLNNLDLELIIYADNRIFISEYYTTLIFTAKNLNNYTTATDEYFINSDLVKEKLKSFKEKQEDYNRKQIVESAQKEIDDAKIELEENRIEGQSELDDAKKKLDKALKEINDAKKEIEDNNQLLIDAQNDVDNGVAELNKNEKILKDNKQLVMDTLSSNPVYAEMSFDKIVESMSNSLNTYNELKTNLDNLKPYRDEILINFPNGVSDIDTAISYLNPAMPNYEEIFTQLKTSKELLINYQTIEDTINTYFTEEVVNNLNTYCPKLKQIQDGEKQIIDGRNALYEAQIDINDGLAKLEEGKKELSKGIKEYNDGKLEYEDGLKEFNEKIQDAEKQIIEAEDELMQLSESKWMILDRDMHYTSYMFKNNCNQMNAIGIIMPILFFLVAALVCMTTMTRLVDEQRGLIGTYRALGYSKSYIISVFLLYVFIASSIGSLPGVFVGMALFPTVIYTTWRLLYLFPKMIKIIPIDKLLISISSFAILMILVTFIVLLQSLKEKPSELMRPKAPKKSKGILLEKIKFIWNRLSFTSKITARNLMRYKARFFMTIIGVAGCTSLLVLGFGIKDSISDVVYLQYGQIFDYNYTINLDDDINLNNIVKELYNDEDNELIIPHMAYTSKLTFDNESDDTINAIVINSHNLNSGFNLKDYKTDELISLSEDGIIISEKFAINNNLSVGDTVKIESKNGISKPVKIDKICKMYFQHYAYISESLYNKLFNDDIAYNSIAILNNGNHQKLFNIIDKYENINSINDFSSFTSQFNVMIEALDLIILVIIITAGALAFVVLLNLIQVNISERTREIATFKVLGFTNHEINVYIFTEIVILTVLGSILGLPLGNIEERFVMNVINMEMIMFPINIKALSYLYSFLITIIFTIIVLLLTIKPLRRINMIESLKSVE